MFRTARFMVMLVAALFMSAPVAFAATQTGSGQTWSAASWVQGNRIDVNTATVQQLARVPGISESTAKAIVAYRDQNGPFVSLNELKYVHGIFPMDVGHLENYLLATY